jgi:hypothetical protein
MSLSLIFLHRSRSSGWLKCMSGKGLEGDRRPSSLRAVFVSSALKMGLAELTEVRQPLELVQAPLEEAGREAC